MDSHEVKPGEHLARIAAEAGFADHQAVWDHPENRGLREKRPHPQILLPGDEVFIPEIGTREESVATDQRHRFRRKGKPLRLRLKLKDFDDQPVANQPCVLEIEGQRLNLETDGAGLLDIGVSKTAETGRLTIPALNLVVPIKIGHLDPEKEESGWKGRLMNLGYFVEADPDSDELRLSYALEEFQCDHGLKITGKPDDATSRKLKEVHGC